MALPLYDFNIAEVAKPRISESAPAVVKADVIINLPKRGDVRQEWECTFCACIFSRNRIFVALRRHDTCFLVSVRPDAPAGHSYDARDTFREQVPVMYVRGCEIDGMLGPDGRVSRISSFHYLHLHCR